MASQSNLILGLGSCIVPPTLSPLNSHNNFSCLWNDGAKYKRVKSLSLVFPICNAISKLRTQEYYKEVLENGLPVIKWNEIVDADTLQDIEVFLSDGIKERVDSIRLMLDSMEDGEISVSPYDTAWVALVEHVKNKDNNGRRVPQFPSSLQWIANHQLPDGSWGDNLIFSAHDRIINTLACVIALKSWNIFPEKCEKGMVFIRENICKLKDENDEHMPIGFEIAFPSLLEIAQKIDINVPHDSPFMKEIYAKRDLKLQRIPKEIFHKVPTTLLHSMEGMEGLEWEKLLKLQSKDGSFLFSPSSTAFALSQTQDENCLNYLKQIVHKFNGGVPNVYPVDLFEHIWVVDRLERLGVSRYFQAEINECLNYVHTYWSEEGICWARNSKVIDIDDTAMGFRLLRLHGYDVSPNVFRHLKKGDGFVCFVGQSTQAVTGMYNLYRASQMKFPGEEILEEANKFSYKFLREKQACNELLDKWIITKDLPGEVGYALDVPWYASLPRVETRFYIEQYGGEDDVWIGKTLYRMPCINNNNYLELAKLDFNDCQAHHQLEWHNIQKWYIDANLEKFGISKRTLLFVYFVASSSIFESEKSEQRLAWAKTSVLIETTASYFNNETTSSEQKRAFINEFEGNSSSTRDYLINGRSSSNLNKFDGGLIETLLRTLNQLSLDAFVAHGRDIRHHLCQSWGKWLRTLDEEEDRYQGEAELLVQTINHCSGGPYVSEEPLLSHPQYLRLSQLTNTVCHQLRYFQKYKEYSNGSCKAVKENMTTSEIELCMQELAQLVLQSSPDDIDASIKQTFLTVAKSFYYAAYCNPGTINFHISKVLFEKVD